MHFHADRKSCKNLLKRYNGLGGRMMQFCPITEAENQKGKNCYETLFFLIINVSVFV